MRYEVIIDNATLCEGGKFLRYPTVLDAVDAAWPYVKQGKRVVLFDTRQTGDFDFWLCRNTDGSLRAVELVGIRRLDDNP